MVVAGEEGAEVSLRGPTQADLGESPQAEGSILGKRRRDELTAPEAEIPNPRAEQHTLTMGEFDETNTVVNPATTKRMNNLILPLDKQRFSAAFWDNLIHSFNVNLALVRDNFF